MALISGILARRLTDRAHSQLSLAHKSDRDHRVVRVSLDLILGYAGIVSLGHAAFFGFGAYTAGLISKWGWGEPLSGLLIAAFAAGRSAT